jgi:hypothetical protein
VSNKDVKQDALQVRLHVEGPARSEAVANISLADALTEDILNTPDDELLREVKEDYGDPRALANKFDQILERAEKQIFGTAHHAASPQVRSSVLDLPISLPDETIRWVNGIFDLGSRLSEFLSSLRPRTLAWSATAAAVAILLPAAVITAIVVKEQGASSGESLARKADRLPREAVLGPDVAVQPPPVALSEKPATRSEVLRGAPAAVRGAGFSAAQAPTEIENSLRRKLSDEEIKNLITRGRQLMFEGDIPHARLVLQQGAETGDATAALELGATYDPTILQQNALKPTASTVESVPAMADMADIRMARLWYEKAKELGSTEAAVRLEKLRSVPNPRR